MPSAVRNLPDWHRSNVNVDFFAFHERIMPAHIAFHCGELKSSAKK